MTTIDRDYIITACFAVITKVIFVRLKRTAEDLRIGFKIRPVDSTMCKRDLVNKMCVSLRSDTNFII